MVVPLNSVLYYKNERYVLGSELRRSSVTFYFSGVWQRYQEGAIGGGVLENIQVCGRFFLEWVNPPMVPIEEFIKYVLEVSSNNASVLTLTHEEMKTEACNF